MFPSRHPDPYHPRDQKQADSPDGPKSSNFARSGLSTSHALGSSGGASTSASVDNVPSQSSAQRNINDSLLAPGISELFFDSPQDSPSTSHQGSPGQGPSLLGVRRTHSESVLREKEGAKSRRERPFIALAEDQPLTSQGKPRARVFVACVQCRTRKIRCDGAKPVCHNCSQRKGEDAECTYDATPKRRGPDRVRGARHRTTHAPGEAVPVRRRRPQEESRESPGSSTSQSDFAPSLDWASSTESFSPHLSPQTTTPCQCHGSFPCPGVLRSSTSQVALSIHPLSFLDTENDIPQVPIASSNIARDYNTYLPTSAVWHLGQGAEEAEESNGPPSSPSANFSRQVWWDSLLSLYSSPVGIRQQVLSSSQRQVASQSIVQDIRFAIKTSSHWFSFIHLPSFFGSFFDPVKRDYMQPSLVLALLATAVFYQSSEAGLGSAGRIKAFRLRDEARASLEASLNAGWIDESLAQAAWILAMFEMNPNLEQTTARSISGMMVLDSIVRSLALTSIDADDPRITVFPAGTVPVVPEYQRHDVNPFHESAPQSESLNCTCDEFTTYQYAPTAIEYAPFWKFTAAWPQTLSEADIRKESCRRLAWSSMILAASQSSFHHAYNEVYPDLFISDPSNYTLLFSGESETRHLAIFSPLSSKDTVWALHERAFLLWHGCFRMRNATSVSDSAKAEFAVKAWIEADALEAALDKHTCCIEMAQLYYGREFLFNTRMCISYEFQRYIPLVSANVTGMFHRVKALDWLNRQLNVAQAISQGMQVVTGDMVSTIALRPFFVWWFMGQITRALYLWRCDNSLVVALELSKAFLPATHHLMTLFPCPVQQRRYGIMRRALDDACSLAGIPPSDLPDPSRPMPLPH